MVIKLVNTHEIKKWFSEPVIGLTQKQLKTFMEAGINMEAFCISSEDNPLFFEIFVDFKETTGEHKRRLVIINRNRERRFYKPETACRLLLTDLGFKEVKFFPAEKRKEIGLDSGR